MTRRTITPRVLRVPFGLLVALAGAALGAQDTSQRAVEHFLDLRRIDSLMRVGAPAQAQPLLERAIPRDSTNGALVFQLARALALQGRCREAIPHYRRAWRMGFSNGPYGALSLARCHARVRDRNAALAWLDTALAHRLDGRTSTIGEDSAFAFMRDDPQFRRRAGLLPPGRVTRVAGWRHDIALFAEEVRRLHPGADRPGIAREFQRRVEALHLNVARLDDDAIMAELLRLTVLLGDGHSNLWWPTPGRVLQMNTYEFADGHFLVDADSTAAPWIGSRVLSVGGVSLDSLRAAITPFMHRDNPMTLAWQFPVYLGLVRMLHLAGAATTAEGAWVTLQSPTGGVGRVFVKADTIWRERKLGPPRGVAGEPPLWLQHVDRNYWFSVLPAERAVYWQMNQVWGERGFPVQALADSLWGTLERVQARALVVDLRLNNGGNAFLTNPLLEVVSAFARGDTARRVVVISGRGTFSAAQILLTRLERYTNVIVAGEPSSSSPNFVG
ncbi:MAG: hypothetical protein JNJ98_10935, partial [Gemmatimonadetes bacterium]|nr:hypothetical protein [Gemmatimonadota bacterium]